ncbi:MAG: ABC transporter ATP-binding protein [Pseudomonadota bacterium]
MTAALALEVDAVSKTFATRDGGTVHALAAISLGVAEGEFVSVIGPSGCGKTTLFQIIGGLLDRDAGEVKVDGRRLAGPHRDIGMVFQEESTFPWRSVLDNVAFPLELAGMPRSEREGKARRFVSLVGLDGFENRYPAELSGGMRQRTALARALAFEPRILLMDEPFAALDEQTRLLLGDKVLQIWRALRQTTLLITHNITEAVQLSDRVVVMSFRPGRVKRIVRIDLPRPRGSEMIAAERFGHYVGLLWQELREEANRGLIESEKL